jgi:hypothetical protein
MMVMRRLPRAAFPGAESSDLSSLVNSDTAPEQLRAKIAAAGHAPAPAAGIPSTPATILPFRAP